MMTMRTKNLSRPLDSPVRGSAVPLETRLRLAGWQFQVDPPTATSPQYRRRIDGNVMYYHGSIEVNSYVVHGRPTQFASPNVDEHMNTLIRVFGLLAGNPDVWEPLPGGGRITYVFGYDRSRES